MIIKMEDVMKRFGRNLALDSFNLEMSKGEVIGLLGPNGAGKTTCIRAIIGLIPVDNGEITVFDELQDGKNRAIKRRIGYVTQELTIYEEMSAMDNLAFFGSLYGLSKEQIARKIPEVAKVIGLEGRLHEQSKQFSGGMKRRLNIGCALMHDPELIIMDEPTVGIDPQSRNFILEFVKELASNGTSILYTSHYIEEVEAVASRICIMDQGHTIASGTLPELIARIKGDSHILIDVRISSEEKLKELRAIPEIKEAALLDNQYHIVVPGGIIVFDKIIAVLSSQSIVNVNSKQPNLEDVFLTLTGKQLRDEA
ncbi:MAG: ABC transporter ATP-binding protein [Sphaerochaeta sp.]|jgi:ABC-2 type transport system ATP-binding protein|nr:ABC transporter ATP-binding protein [Sphaerochaeta sp.]HHT80021.1 ABC transporter ATP-binding protein [Spirochaetales bacterium]HKM07311.1 ABC transporter ATP-binding protein [Sphaerochaeta sp.]